MQWDGPTKHDVVTHELTTLLFGTDTTLVLQNVKGSQNEVSNFLSWDFHLTNKKIYFALTSLYPT